MFTENDLILAASTPDQRDPIDTQGPILFVRRKSIMQISVQNLCAR
jgi:hypothetical protein